MEVEVNGPAIDPFRNLIRDVGKRTKILPLLLKHFVAAAVALLEGLVVELIQFVRNALFQFGEGVIHVVPASGDDRRGNLPDCTLYGRLLLLISNY